MSVTHLLRLTLAVAAMFAVAAQSEPLTLGAGERTALALTIYNDNLVLVNDSYRVNIPKGDEVLDFNAISPLLLPASAILHGLPDGIDVGHQYYQAPLTPAELLQKAVGETVTLVRTHPQSGAQTSQTARVLAAGNGLILEIDGRYETDLDGRRIVYDRLPEGVLEPTLSFEVQSAESQTAEPVLSYLGSGVSWQADYIARLNPAHDSMQLICMATLANHSGMDFEQARIELVAGQVNQAAALVSRMTMQAEAMVAVSKEAAPRAALGDLHLYQLPGLHTLAEGETRQLRLFSIAGVPVEKRYRLNGSAGIFYSALPGEQTLRADSFIEFVNDEEQALGLPLPAGTIRAYTEAEDATGNLKFIGSDRIEHTPALAPVSIRTGSAFDISAVRRQLEFKRLPVEQPYRQHSEVQLQTVIRNARDEAVTVEVSETFGGEWQLVKGPDPEQRDAQGAVWKVAVPAQGQAELLLSVRVKR